MEKVKQSIKKYIYLSMFVVIVLSSCSTEKVESEVIIEKSFYTVSNISERNGGKLISLIDYNGINYTTFMIENEFNYNEIKVGDYISLYAGTILENHPSQIIKNSDIFIEKSNEGKKYKQIEVKEYWINSEKFNYTDQNTEDQRSFQYVESDELRFNNNWLKLSDEIQYFNYIPGYFYKVKVQKKWIDSDELLTNKESFEIELISVIEKVKDEAYINPYITTISLDKNTYKIDDPIYLTFEAKNTSAYSLTFLPWGTPLEDLLTNDCLDVYYNDELIDYQGILVSRMAPSEKDYISLISNDSVKNTINILDSYDFSKKGTYSIRFGKENYLLALSNTVVFEIIN
ncbi:MAG: hypothetical protein ACPKM0_12945 [Pleomorphochaeta sp.]